MDHNSMISGRT